MFLISYMHINSFLRWTLPEKLDRQDVIEKNPLNDKVLTQSKVIVICWMSTKLVIDAVNITF